MIEWIQDEPRMLGQQTILLKTNHKYTVVWSVRGSCTNLPSDLAQAASTLGFEGDQGELPPVNAQTNGGLCMISVTGRWMKSETHFTPYALILNSQMTLVSVHQDIPGAPPQQLYNAPALQPSPTLQPPFPLPKMPGVPADIIAQATAALTRAATACPNLTQPTGPPGSPLAHAASAFAIMAVATVAAGGNPQKNLDALHQQLDKLCPAWRGGVPTGQPPPTGTSEISDLLTKLDELLKGAGDLATLPDLAKKVKELGLDKLAEMILEYATGKKVPIPPKPDGGVPKPPAPPPDPPPPGPPPPPPTEEPGKPTKKKKTSTALIVGGAALGIGLIAWSIWG